MYSINVTEVVFYFAFYYNIISEPVCEGCHGDALNRAVERESDMGLIWETEREAGSKRLGKGHAVIGDLEPKDWSLI